MFEENIIMDTDSYKYSHYLQQEAGTTSVYSYLEPRIGALYSHVLFFGLKYYLRKLEQRVTAEMVEEAKTFAAMHGEPFNYEGWMYIAKDLKGKLPLEIRAVAEGTIVPVNNVLLTVKSTDSKCWWLTSWVETYLMRIWYPTTVATRSWHIKRMLSKYIADSSDDLGQIAFKLHDFGARGSTSQESAALAGAAHLVNFMGSDTIVGVRLANKLYHEKMAGFSIPACYDDETEILTPSGFRKFATLTPEDKVAQYSGGGAIDFVTPSKIHAYDFDGKLVDFTSDNACLSVTPNHRIVRYSVAKAAIEVVEAGDSGYSHRNCMVVSGFIRGNSEISLSMEDRLRIAFQADGSFASRADSYNGNRSGGLTPIRFTLKKERKKQRLEWILNSLGISYSKTDTDKGAKRGYSHYWIKSDMVFSKTFDWVKLGGISAEWAMQFIEETSYWDGHRPTENCFRYDSTVQDNVDVVQSLACLCGMRSSMSVYQDKRKDHLRKPLYSLNIIRDTTLLGGQYILKSERDYTGKVFCVTVPSGMVVVRKDGVVCVSGNSEHTTIISWGKDKEVDAYRNMITQFAKPGALFAVVSDSYDLDNAVRNIWGGTLKAEVVKSGATLVVRPDSGDPVTVVMRTLTTLAEKFGFSYNTKAKKVLKNVRVIQGDGIDEESIPLICEAVTRANFAMDNINFGMGAGLHQKNMDRDTQRFAYKASEVVVDGQARAISKNPADDATKASKAGKQDLVYRDGRLQTVVGEGSFGSLLKVAYRNGDMTPEADITFAQVRENSNTFKV